METTPRILIETTPHILIVDDDPGICDALSQFLQQHEYKVSIAQNGKEMKALLVHKNIDLIILDVMMPGEDGMRLCRQLRTTSSIPILMLTAINEEIERIVGLEIGADDYLSKPFNPRELLARMRAILRRTTNHKPLTKEITEYRFNGWTLNKPARYLISPDNVQISLSGSEYALLLIFLENPQQILSREHLFELTHPSSGIDSLDRGMDVQIGRLRNKIEMDQKNPQIIKTIRGGGYVLASTVEHN